MVMVMSCIELLLEKEVPVNTQNTTGTTAIYLASQNGHSSVVSTLLNSGADPNITTNDGWTPLMISSTKEHYNVVEELLTPKLMSIIKLLQVLQHYIY